MKMEINANLPFSWCKFCKKRDLRESTIYEDNEVFEKEHFCENADICEGMAKAMRRETMIRIPGEIGQETLDGSIKMNLRLEAILPKPGTILDNEKWIAEVERQFRDGLDRAIRDIRTKGWPG